MKRTVVLCLFVAAISSTVTAVIAFKFNKQLVYVTTKPMQLFSRSGATVGIVAKGAYVISEDRPMISDDTGWFGCLPVYLGTGHEASLVLHRASPQPPMLLEDYMTLYPVEHGNNKNK